MFSFASVPSHFLHRVMVCLLLLGLIGCANEPFVTDEGSAAAKSAEQDARYHAEHPIIPVRAPGSTPDFVK